MKEYFKTNSYSTPKEKEEAKYLNIYANTYAKYVDDDEDHIYQHMYDNLLDAASVNKLKRCISILKEDIHQHISILKKNIDDHLKGESDE